MLLVLLLQLFAEAGWLMAPKCMGTSQHRLTARVCSKQHLLQPNCFVSKHKKQSRKGKNENTHRAKNHLPARCVQAQSKDSQSLNLHLTLKNKIQSPGTAKGTFSGGGTVFSWFLIKKNVSHFCHLLNPFLSILVLIYCSITQRKGRDLTDKNKHQLNIQNVPLLPVKSLGYGRS